MVGLRPDSSSRADAEAEGLRVLDVADAASAGDVVMILLPDEKQAEVWEKQIRDGIAPGNLLLFAHGFTIHFGQIEPPRRSTWRWSPRRGRAISCAGSSPRAAACPA